jgi:hypothetical protein
MNLKTRIMKMSNPNLTKMKTIIICSWFLFCTAFSGYSTETVSFKFSNPRIVYNSGTNYLGFDILMKATANGTYLYSSQVICNVNYANFNITAPPSFIKGFIAGQYNIFPGPNEDKYITTINWNSNNINIAIYGNTDFNGQSPSSGAYCEVTTSWQILGTVYAKISSLTGTAGINFQVAAINGYQKYATGVSPYYSSYYATPSLFEGNDFTDLYLGRIYSASSGWSQAGGTVDWTQSINTSVWDTTASAAVITGTVAGSECKTGGLRIYSGARLKIDKDHPLTATGNTDIGNERGLWIQSAADGTGSFKDNGTINYSTGGTTRVELYLTGNRWHYLSSPIQDGLSGIFYLDYIRAWNEPTYAWGSWITTMNVPLGITQGYEVWINTVSKTKIFNGRLNKGTESTGTLTYTSSGGGGWNLIGNPYPSAQDFGSQNSPVLGWTWPSNVDKILYFLKTGDGTNYSYATYSYSGGGGDGVGVNGGTRYIPAMQGYFVKINTTPATIGMDNQTRVHNSQPLWKQAETGIQENLLRLVASSDKFSDETVVYFNDNLREAFDNDYDAYKFSNGDSVPNIYSTTSDAIKVAINGLNFGGETTLVPVGFTSGISGMFCISPLNTESFRQGMVIILEDLKEHVNTLLDTQTKYYFTYNTGDDPNRFLLHFSNPYFGIPGAVSSHLQVYSYGDGIYVQNQPGRDSPGFIVVYDLIGKEVFHENLKVTQLSKYIPGLEEGYYMVKVVNKSESITRKVYLN